MFKKFLFFVSVAITAITMASILVLASDVTIDKSNIAKGVVSVSAASASEKTVKVQVEKGTEKYTYTLKDANPATIPLQMDAGDYKVTVLESIGGNKYKALTAETINMASYNENTVYTNSIQLINFNNSMASIQEMNKLIGAAKNDEEKISIIYNYLIKNVTYDYNKFSRISNDYIPVIDEVYAEKTGICYDYAALFASVLRDNNIPTKLQMGYASEIKDYHAWNEVKLNGKWVKIDTTYDSQLDSYKLSYSMIKDNGRFKVVKQY